MGCCTLLLGRIRSVCSLVAPCQARAARQRPPLIQLIQATSDRALAERLLARGDVGGSARHDGPRLTESSLAEQ